jgi:hypothetical protein
MKLDQELEELPTVKAEAYFEITVMCPHCDCYQVKTDELKEHLDHNELRAESCEVEIKCEECENLFIVNTILY